MSRDNQISGDYQHDGPAVGSQRSEDGTPESRATKDERPASPLANLLAHIAEQAPHKQGNTLPTEPPETEYFQKTWERLSTRLRLEQSQLQVPDNAGPLNSSQLIHRALLLMQDRSPAYLQHFLSYVDTLSWIEQLSQNGSALPAQAASKTAAKAKPKPQPKPKSPLKTAPTKKPARRKPSQ